MGKLKSIENKLVQIPEWSMEFYAQAPTVSEIEAAAKYLLENPELAKAEDAIDAVVVALIARTKDGARHFEDAAIAVFLNREPAVIKRIASDCGAIYAEVATAISNLVSKT